MNTLLFDLGPSTRNLFGQILTERGLLGTAVEIGTHRGEFARVLMENWNGQKLYCVDPYTNYSDKDPASQGNRHDDYNEAKKQLNPYGDRVEFVHQMSGPASYAFEDNSLDFVYVDGNHEPDFVWDDLLTYWRKVKPEGILAGHDFLCPGEPDGLWGMDIQRLVIDFSNRYSVTINLIPEENTQPWSYYMIKEESSL